MPQIRLLGWAAGVGGRGCRPAWADRAASLATRRAYSNTASSPHPPPPAPNRATRMRSTLTRLVRASAPARGTWVRKLKCPTAAFRSSRARFPIGFWLQWIGVGWCIGTGAQSSSQPKTYGTSSLSVGCVAIPHPPPGLTERLTYGPPIGVASMPRPPLRCAIGSRTDHGQDTEMREGRSF